MGRKSKLTPEQWAQIDRRLVAGERPSHLAKEYGVNPSQITRRGGKEGLAQKTQKVREVAQSLAQAQTALAALPVAEQHTAVRLAEQLRQTSEHLAGASVNASAIAHRLTSIASTEMDKVDDTDPLATVGHLKSVSTLMNLAKEAAHIPLNLLAANKDLSKRAGEDQPPVGSVKNMTLEDATRAYQDLMVG